jgi:hypothetical protein
MTQLDTIGRKRAISSFVMICDAPLRSGQRKIHLFFLLLSRMQTTKITMNPQNPLAIFYGTNLIKIVLIVIEIKLIDVGNFNQILLGYICRSIGNNSYI